MGYYSDVCIHMNRAAYDVVKEKYVNDGIGYLLKDNECDIEDYGSEVILYWNCIKWYESCGEVQYVMDMLDALDADNYEWCFVRRGEEYDDIEFIVSEAYGWNYEHSPHVDISW